MSKISLRYVRLVNWYGFVDEGFPISDELTLISGENECGKSTILDAIKYAFTGDTQFNKSTNAEGGRGRTLESYTRCLTDPSAGRYARPAQTHPSVYSHIGLEYLDETDQTYYVLGVILTTTAAGGVNNDWYVIAGRRIAEVVFTEERDGGKAALAPSAFKRINHTALMDKREGITQFMTTLGLRLDYDADVPKYQRKLRNLMSYNPSARIGQFIRESVLEPHDVKLDKLKDARDNISGIQESLRRIEHEMADIDRILDGYQEYEKLSRRIRRNEIKRTYRDLVDAKRDMTESSRHIDENTAIQSVNRTRVQDLESEDKDTQDELSEVNRALRENDATRAIAQLQEQIASDRQTAAGLKEACDKLAAFQERIGSARALLTRYASDTRVSAQEAWEAVREGLDDPASVILSGLQDPKTDPTVKQTAVDTFRGLLTTASRSLTVAIEADRREKGEHEERINRLNEVIREYERGRMDYSYASEQTALIGEINAQLIRSHIPGEARMVCEYVSDLTDESWRDAIETFLGPHRYAILVPPEGFEEAVRAMKASRHRYTELVNVALLEKKEFRIEEDSVYHFLQIKNPYAAKYFAYWLGRIHAVAEEDVPKYESAMSREGRISRNMAVTYLNFRKNRNYCLGQEAVRLNLERARRQAAEEQTAREAAYSHMQVLTQDRDSIEACQTLCTGEYVYDCVQRSRQIATQILEEEAKLAQLTEAQKNDRQMAALLNRQTELMKKACAIRSSLDQARRAVSDAAYQIDHWSKNLDSARQRHEEISSRLKEDRKAYPIETQEAIEEYDGFLADGKRGDVVQEASLARSRSRLAQLEVTICSGEAQYNMQQPASNRLPEDLSAEEMYRRRRERIRMDDLQEIQQNLREQTRRYEKIFKNEFVLTVYHTAQDAIRDTQAISRELARLGFATRYSFDLKLRRDDSDYARILSYASYIEENGLKADGQMTLLAMQQDAKEVEEREEVVRDIIDRILDEGRPQLMQQFADYRNYMTYEINLDNEQEGIHHGRLSQQAGYNSGAGTQIPYTIMLVAALSILYNNRSSSVRLAFMDEPFEKMSDHNIQIMLGFFKKQNLQVIFCAPPNRLDSIGSECGVIIPVIKESNDRMYTGQIQFHDSP